MSRFVTPPGQPGDGQRVPMARYNGPDNQPPVVPGPALSDPPGGWDMAYAAPGAVYPKPKRSIWPWVIGLVLLTMVVLCGLGAMALSGAAKQVDKAIVTVPATGTPHGPAEKAAAKASPTTKAAEPVAPVKTTKAISVEQANANEAAASYLSNQAFSRKSLIDQLKFEGYGAKAATVAVDSLNADWNEQAVLSAKQYLENQSFSKKSLINQLEFEGFTSAQAKYGVSKTGL